MRGTKGRSDLVVGGDRTEVPGVEIIKLPNKEVDIVRGESVVFLKIVESDKRKSSGEVPPENMNRGAGVLGRTNNVYHRGIKGEGRRNMDLD